MTSWHNVFQPIYKVDKNLNKKAAYYEMLLHNEDDAFPEKEFLDSIANEQDGQRWINFETASLKELFRLHPGIGVHLNIDPVQFAYPSVWTFLQKCHDLYGNHVVIEVTERQSQVGNRDDCYFNQAFKKIHNIGFKIALDDVGSGGHSLAFVRRHLEAINCIKLSMLIFRGMDSKTAALFTNAWASFAQEYHLNLVLEAVPDMEVCAHFAGNDHILMQANILQRPLPLNDFEI
jgi:EAL domain-containing protein (putative c-di-GMP-specific phosphodiesterase class I)